ncbi:phage minor capsid protein [Streptomyces sp. PSAA01]|uniref:phage minor capsid protein n=1 Tax=Streptomyces sp. PSAA01 TaxID=2912762 RepID=UPI001F20FB40|nr:phage minor capsid protein [Streptomyces sp. PSAA01]MCG0289844.1 phage minor capsid protein [Streptomyces sp. PSAA01]
MSAYTPGLTTVEQVSSGPAGYTAGQRQRAIERRIRKYKRRTAASVNPAAKRAAEAKVRHKKHASAHEGEGRSNAPRGRSGVPSECGVQNGVQYARRD